MSGAFVIHIHSGYGRDHYDLMLQRGQVLATWQLWVSPAGLPAGQAMAAKRIADHRIGYLDYQGPVSGGRGHVTRFDKGTYDLLDVNDTRWRVEFNGRYLAGRFELRRAGEHGEEWTLLRLGETPAEETAP